ncbi:MAG: flavodoxin family protein [Candidatus Syntrophonatronum acetioxidans]|uniref:Flavodoxin family protein n=1 Tax=Candidatus Syntrophonatronum acetioxidans TaxID=1795816 RepID=A0A424YAM7_9FIRM|nr:MAG: flavodoxin family protein [Candidatus Syntrophonatronum acetioxidans]
MKVLGMVGSPRKKGNTSILVQEALKPFEKEGIETELVFLKDYEIEGCRGCEGCKDTYKCVIEDDMQKLYPVLLECEGIILGSPAYFYNISAFVKAFIDRCYPFVVFDSNDRSVWLSLNEALGIKYALVIGVCEQEEEGDMGWTVEGMIKPLESLGYRVVDTVKALHLFEPGEALYNEKAMEKAKKGGEKLLKTMQLKEKVSSHLNQDPL